MSLDDPAATAPQALNPPALRRKTETRSWVEIDAFDDQGRAEPSPVTIRVLDGEMVEIGFSPTYVRQLPLSDLEQALAEARTLPPEAMSESELSTAASGTV